MPSELDIVRRINSTYPNGIPGPGTVIVRAEEALIVILVLLLWAAAIALFFNRWGKIRMLEPYQPKFQQQHRSSCATIEQNQLQNRRTYSRCNILLGDFPAGLELNYGGPGQGRPRQNSVFIGSSSTLLPGGHGTPRRTKSAFDLQFLIVANETNHSESTFRTESSKLTQRDVKTNVCQLEKTSETVNKGLTKVGTMTSQSDNSSRYHQRDRRLSIDLRPLQRDRIGSIYHFDRMDVLARPNFIGKSVLRERRVSMCNFMERNEDEKRVTVGKRWRSSVNNVARIEDNCGPSGNDDGRSFKDLYEDKVDDTLSRFDQPSCSKTSDLVLGYKATCV